MEPVIIRNKKINAQDLKFIQAVIHEHWDKGRTHISKSFVNNGNGFSPVTLLKILPAKSFS